MLKRNMSTATGVSAMTRPAITAATDPNDRRTVTKRRATVATPRSASGRRMAHEFRPRRRTESPMSQIASGGLSMVMKLPASSEPKKSAPQSWEAACAAIE